MKASELRTKSRDHLSQMAGELRATVRNLRFTVGTPSRANVRDLRKARKELARVLTVKNATKT
jgi:ribosomal protein L29